MDPLNPEQRRKNMQAIKSKDTKEEILLAKTLWHLGYRYRRNCKTIFGKPDIVFTKYKIAIFVDGEFFHGFNWEIKKTKIQANRDFWIKKIERNMQRDIEVNTYLRENGWTVLRFWSAQIKNNLPSCVAQIQEAIEKAKGL
jgi:DNA mismatch endonuclease, patch repair protein